MAKRPAKRKLTKEESAPKPLLKAKFTTPDGRFCDRLRHRVEKDLYIVEQSMTLSSFTIRKGLWIFLSGTKDGEYHLMRRHPDGGGLTYLCPFAEAVAAYGKEPWVKAMQETIKEHKSFLTYFPQVAG